MSRHHLQALGVALMLGPSFVACQPSQSLPAGGNAAPPTAVVEPPLLEPAVPPGYTRVAPGSAASSRDIFAQTGSIVRGHLKNVRFTYDECAGPRTEYLLTDVAVIAGGAVASEVTLKVFGGPTPAGTWLVASELPELAVDSDYVVFLRSSDWTFSPVLEDLVLRREVLKGREVLIEPNGRAVTAWDERGPVFSAGPVSERVGAQHHRMSGPQPAPAHVPSGEPDAGARLLTAAERHSKPAAVADTTFSRAPTLAEARAGGHFVSPALSDALLANTQVLSVEQFGARLKAAIAAGGEKLNGRVALEPYWRCWSATPTASAREKTSVAATKANSIEKVTP